MLSWGRLLTVGYATCSPGGVGVHTRHRAQRIRLGFSLDDRRGSYERQKCHADVSFSQRARAVRLYQVVGAADSWGPAPAATAAAHSAHRRRPATPPAYYRPGPTQAVVGSWRPDSRVQTRNGRGERAAAVIQVVSERSPGSSLPLLIAHFIVHVDVPPVPIHRTSLPTARHWHLHCHNRYS